MLMIVFIFLNYFLFIRTCTNYSSRRMILHKIIPLAFLLGLVTAFGPVQDAADEGKASMVVLLKAS